MIVLINRFMQQTVEVTNLNAFKSSLITRRNTMMGFFMN